MATLLACAELVLKMPRAPPALPPSLLPPLLGLHGRPHGSEPRAPGPRPRALRHNRRPRNA
eukprot:2629312-Alexandrium_andersonii.AAC.1